MVIMNSVVVIDYSVGNIDSVLKAVRWCGGNAIITRDSRDVETCSHIILPGVGSFDKAFGELKRTGLIHTLRDQVVNRGIPILGICVGMQLMASYGEEGSGSEGLGLIPGKVTRISAGKGYKLPHVGWNDIHYVNDTCLFTNIPDGKDFYFSHSFCFRSDDRQHVVAEVMYSEAITAAIQKDNIYGVQFHPEKSQKVGMQLLKNFIEA